MMMNKKKILIRNLIIYLTVICSVTLFGLTTKIGEIIENFNVFFISIWLINLFVIAVNLSFWFRKRSENDYKIILPVNSIYSFISGLEFRGGGYILSNNLGPDLSIYFKKNCEGIDYGLHYDLFNVIIKLLFYDNTKCPQFSIQLNLIMLTVSLILLFNYKKMKANCP